MKYILQGISIIVVFYSFFMIIKQIFDHSRGKKTNDLNKIDKESVSERRESIKIFLLALLFRIFIFLISIFIYYIFVNENANFNIKDVIDNWVKWDAGNYIKISHGYRFFVHDGYYLTIVFFPLYSWLIHLFNLIIGSREITGLLVSFLEYSLACVYIYKLVCLDYEKSIAYKTIILISISPFAFFFGAIMSESTFLLFSTMTLYYIRKHKWFLVGVFGFLSSLSRLIGVFLIIPAFVEILEEYKVLKNIKNYKYLFNVVRTKILPILIIPLGIVVYLFINYSISNDWFYFLKIQRKFWNQEFTPFYQILVTLINTINSQSTYISFITFIPELITVLLMYLILVLEVKKNRMMYVSWLFIYIIVNISISWPLSLGRYFLCALPAFIFLAKWCQKRKYLFYTLIIIFTIFFTVFLAAYLCYKHIM